MALSEFELIRRFFTHSARHAVLGVGDDAAIVRARRGKDLVVTTDMLVAGRHFRRGADPERLGHKALAVNLSDMAAMGAAPRWATLAIALPSAEARWLAAFSRGFMRLARRHGVDLVGGDTTRGPLNICVQVVGEAPRGRAGRPPPPGRATTSGFPARWATRRSRLPPGASAWQRASGGRCGSGSTRRSPGSRSGLHCAVWRAARSISPTGSSPTSAISASARGSPRSSSSSACRTRPS